MIISQILTAAATWAPWWSFPSLWNSLRALQWAAAISALVLTIGAVIEYWDKLKLLTLLICKWLWRKSTAFDRCVFNKLVFHSIGPILVVIGIAGDFIFEGRAFILEDRQEEQAQKIVGTLQDKADAVSREADELTTRLDGVKTEVGSVKMSAGQAQSEADAVHREADELNRQLATSKGELKAAEADASELKKSLAPRKDLPFIQGHGKSNIDEMKTFFGIKVILKFVPEYLTMKSAVQIEQRVTDAQWEVVSRIPDSSIWPGVRVYRHSAPSITPFGNADEQRSKGAAKALCDFLRSFDWDCDVSMGSRGPGLLNVPPNTLMVEVGLKPEPYFIPSWEKPIDPNKPIKQQIDERDRDFQKYFQQEFERHVPPN